MHSASVVIAFQVLEKRTPKLRFSQDCLVDLKFPLERAEERFSTGIVPAVALPAHTLRDIPAFRKGVPCFLATILDTPIGMNDEIRENSSIMKRIFPGLGDQRCLHVILDCPANDPATEEVDENAKIHPPMICPDVGYVADPDLAWSSYRKLPVQEVFGNCEAMLRVGCQHESPLGPHEKAVFPHQSGDPVVPKPAMHFFEFPCHSRAAVVAMLAPGFSHIGQKQKI